MLYQRRSTFEFVQSLEGTSGQSEEPILRKISCGLRRCSGAKGARRASKGPMESRRTSRGGGGGMENRGMDELEGAAGGMEPEELEELEDRLGEMVDPRAVLGRHRRHGLLGSSSRQWPPSSMDSGVDSDLANSLLEGNGGEENSLPGKAQTGEKGARKYAKLILPHVALVMLTCCYTLLGASLFYIINISIFLFKILILISPHFP